MTVWSRFDGDAAHLPCGPVDARGNVDRDDRLARAPRPFVEAQDRGLRRALDVACKTGTENRRDGQMRFFERYAIEG